MDNNQNNETFSYSYSAKEQEEVKRIREKYEPRQADKMERLRTLDRGVTRKGTVLSLIIGIVGALVMGTGMCCAMLWEMFAVGIAVGVIGMVLIAVAYPIYTGITKKEREKIAPEMIRLTDELMK